MTSVAARVITPDDPTIFRTVFLFVGQGDCTLHVIPNGEGGVRYCLVDINMDEERGGTDVVRLLEDLLPKDGDGKPVLDLFINTHPHSDHIRGLEQINQRILVKEVWHTGFTPSDTHAGAYEHLAALIDRVRKREGDDAVSEYQGTRKDTDIGAVEAHIVSPAKHVKDEIDKLKGEERDARIHEYCGVIRLGYGSETTRRHVLHTGDSDRSAWEDHILGEDDYHADRLPSAALRASHHGSRSFFKVNEDDDPYVHHVDTIDPTWVIVSSPIQAESPHGHPHDDAIALYKEHVRDAKAANVIVLGEKKEARIYDIFPDGSHIMDGDDGELARAYPIGGDKDDPDDRGTIGAPAVITRVDHSRPMGRAAV